MGIAAAALAFGKPRGPSTIAQRQARLVSLLRHYVRDHSAPVPSAKAAQDAGSGYAVAYYMCPQEVGNRMHQFLNAFAVAVATNRTVLWSFGSSDGLNPFRASLSGCQAVLPRRAWLQPATSLHTAVKRHGLYIRGADRALACGRIDGRHGSWHRDGHRSVDLGPVHRQQAAAMAAEVASTHLSPETAARARLLFSLGPFYAFGSLMRTAFDMNMETVVRPVVQALVDAGLITAATAAHARPWRRFGRDERKHPGAVWIAVHMRHSNPRNNGSESAAMFWPFVADLVRRRLGPAPPPAPGGDLGAAPRCAVLLASDRALPARMLSPLAKTEGCVVVQAPALEVRQTRRFEHGSNTGAGAIRDLLLLALGDSLVGSLRSTFSLLAANMMAAMASPRERPELVECRRGKRPACLPPRPLRPEVCCRPGGADPRGGDACVLVPGRPCAVPRQTLTWRGEEEYDGASFSCARVASAPRANRSAAG